MITINGKEYTLESLIKEFQEYALTKSDATYTWGWHSGHFQEFLRYLISQGEKEQEKNNA